MKKNNKAVMIIIFVAIFAVGMVAGYFTGSHVKSKEIDAENAFPSLVIDDFVMTDRIIDDYIASPTFTSDYLMKNFEMDEGSALRFMDSPADWLAFTAYVSIKNTSDIPLSFKNAVYEDNGQNNMYIFTGDMGELSIPAGMKSSTSLVVLINNNDMTFEEAKSLFMKADIAFAYSETKSDGTAVESTSLVKIEK